ncbi:sulfotransferase 1 family member D1-like isoform X2 [Aphelocoma coerulescens]|uniref:sulfotransferase 1 family member D1-like isoform X2 n=1 Tax=Aphelocoma coerulescens TaxID=39617 RepID=UPI0036043842
MASIHVIRVASCQGSGHAPVALAVPLPHVIWAGLRLMGHCPGHSPATGSSTAPGTVLAQEPASPEVVEAASREDSQFCVHPLLTMEQKDAIRQELGSLHGIPLFKSFIEGWPQVKTFQAHPDDLLISTYPKSGTTWLSEIMDMIYHDGDVEKCRRDAIYNRVPFLEMKVSKGPSVAYGSWYDHVRGWWEKKQEKMLYLFYEDMKKDPRREVQKILQFLGKELAEGTVERILHHTSFQEMKKNPAANYETMLPTVMDHSVSPFLRKGISGDWKNHFTVAQNERFNQHYQEHMAGSDLHFLMEV